MVDAMASRTPSSDPSTDGDPSATARIEQAFALAKAAAAGDAVATTRLLQEIAPRMMRVVGAVMGPQGADVEDVVQQSLIAFIQALPAFRGECEPASYGCRIAVRIALAARRRSRVERARTDGDADSDLMASPYETPDDDATGQRRKRMLRNLLEELPAEQAEALAMRVVLGWSLEEIAESSAAPLNTIRSRLRLAKEAMRRKIEADPQMAEELGGDR